MCGSWIFVADPSLTCFEIVRYPVPGPANSTSERRCVQIPPCRVEPGRRRLGPAASRGVRKTPSRSALHPMSRCDTRGLAKSGNKGNASSVDLAGDVNASVVQPANNDYHSSRKAIRIRYGFVIYKFFCEGACGEEIVWLGSPCVLSVPVCWLWRRTGAINRRRNRSPQLES